MKKSIIFFFLLLSINVSAQSDILKQIQFLENHYKNSAHLLLTEYNGRSYSIYTYGDQIIDSLIHNLLTTSIPNPAILKYLKYIKGNLKFKKVVDDINRFRVKRQKTFLDMDTLIRRIEEFSIVERVIGKELLLGTIVASNSTPIFNAINRKDQPIPPIPSNITINQLTEIYLSTSKTLRHLGQKEGSIQTLYALRYLLDSAGVNKFQLGLVEEQLAEIYELSDMPPYLNQAIRHFNEAENYYTSSKNRSNAAIAKLKKNYLLLSTNPSTHFFDLARQWANRVKHKSENEIVNDIFNKQYEDLRHEILFGVDEVLSEPFLRSVEAIAANVSLILGGYFWRLGDLNTALVYHKAAVISAFSKTNDIYQILHCLQMLSSNYLNLGNVEMALKYVNFAIELCSEFNDQIKLQKLNIYKAYIYRLQKKHNNAIDLVQNSLQLLKADEDWNEIGYVNEGYDLLTDLYRDIGDFDQSQMYKDSSFHLRIDRLNEFEKLARFDIEGQSEVLNISINRVSGKLQNANDSLEAADGKIKKQVHEIDSLRGLRNKLISETIGLRTTGILLSKKNQQLAEDNIKIGRDNTILEGIAVLAAVIITGIALAFFFRIKVKNQKIFQTKFELEYLAKSKIHNMKVNFGTIEYYAYKKDYHNLIKYAEYSGLICQSILEKWEVRNVSYTLKDEIQILREFYETQRMMYQRDVEIIEELNGMDPELIRFIPDILTTLFHNSIKYGFRDQSENCKFFISLTRNGKILNLSVWDNGVPSSKESYFKDPTRGLSIMRSRIVNHFKDKGVRLRNIEKMYVEFPKVGTLIQINFPYELSVKSYTC